MKGHSRESRCSFCGKRQDQVRRLIAGPGVFICDQCVALCTEVLGEPPPSPAPPGTPERRGWNWRSFGPGRRHKMAPLSGS